MFLAFNFGEKRLIISTREEFARILPLGVYEGQFVLIDSIVFHCTFCYVTASRRIECFLRIFSISLRYLDPKLYLLIAAYGERSVLYRPNMRVMRWRNGALSGSDLENEPGLGSSRTYQPGEMPLPTKPRPGLRRMHQERTSEAASSSSQLRIAVPPKRARVEEEVQTNETMQHLNGTVEEQKNWRRPEGSWTK